MRPLTAFLCILMLGFLLLSPASSPAQSPPIMPVDEVRPGMIGVAKTVFTGTEIEEFKVKVLDIMQNFFPKRDIILVRLLGDKAEHAGVVAGMSGSPVYIDGKLVGAIAYRFGDFPKDPVAGVTPIQSMLEVVERDRYREQELATVPGGGSEYLNVALGFEPPTWEVFVPASLRKTNEALTASGLRPIETPLLFGGFGSGVLSTCRDLLGKLGFQVMQTGIGSSSSDGEPIPVEPGGAVSGVILDGDMSIAATGTITYRSGNRILGFGHFLFNNGAVSLPMAQARILTTLASYSSSNKMAVTTDVIGTIHQDRSTGIMGIIGQQPEMFPVHVAYHSSLGGGEEFRFRVTDERSINSLTPLFLRVALLNAIESARLAAGAQTTVVKGSIRIKDYGEVRLDNFYAGQRFTSFVGFLNDALQSTGEVVAALGSLMLNDFVIPKIESVDLSFTTIPGQLRATVEKVWYDKTEVEPGDTLNLTIFLQRYQGGVEVVRQKVEIPKSVTSRLISVLIGGGPSVQQWERRVAPRKYQPQNFREVVDLLNNRRRNDRLYIQVQELDRGALVDGQELPALPPSVLSVMNSNKTAGSVTTLRYRLVSEKAIPMKFAVSGLRTIRLRVKSTAF